MNRMRAMTGGHRLVAPVTGTGTGRVGQARSASLIRWPGEVRNGLQQTSHVMSGPSAGPVLAKINRGGVHLQRHRPASLLAPGILGYGLPRGHGLAHRLDLGREQPERLARKASCSSARSSLVLRTRHWQRQAVVVDRIKGQVGRNRNVGRLSGSVRRFLWCEQSPGAEPG
jgi:hypothetical protein